MGTDRIFQGLGALLAVLALVAIPFGGSDSSGSESAGGGAPQMANEVAIADFEFVPPDITVAAGTEVTWTNEDSAKHTATASDGSDIFTTDTLEQGDSKSVTLEEPGSYEYFCQFHAFMTGTVTVE